MTVWGNGLSHCAWGDFRAKPLGVKERQAISGWAGARAYVGRPNPDRDKEGLN